MTTGAVSQFFLALPVWLLNGFLAVVYWAAAHIFDFIALLAAAFILFGLDPLYQERAVMRPRRYGRGEAQTGSLNAQYFTLATLAAWLIVSLTSEFPVPLIGAVLWMLAMFGILLVSEERVNQQWWAKTGLLTYAGLVLVLRFGILALNQVSPADWAGVVGSSADAQIVLDNTRGNVAMIGMIFTFVLYPLGYAGMLLNRFVRNPKGLFNSFREAGEIMERLRVR